MVRIPTSLVSGRDATPGPDHTRKTWGGKTKIGAGGGQIETHGNNSMGT